jgi:hypothetical protein
MSVSGGSGARGRGCVRQLLLQASDFLEAAGHVTHDGGEAVHLPLLILERHNGELQRDPLAVLADTRHRQEVARAVMALTGCYDVPEALPVACTQALRDDEIQRLPQRLAGVVAEDPFGPGVPHPDDPFAVGCHDRIRGGRKNGIGNQSGQFHSGLLCCQGHLGRTGRNATSAPE